MQFSWWCVALERPWTWAWIPYPGVWIAMTLPLALYGAAVRRRPGETSRRQIASFVGGVAVLWVASDWPLGTLGAGYLASAHVVQFLLYAFVAVPLLLRGTPAWLARELLARTRLERPVAALTGSLLVSGLVYNALLVATHAPVTVNVLRTSQLGSFAMDVAWVVAGVVLWMPVLSPLPELRTHGELGLVAYLFLSTSVLMMVVSSLITFTKVPIYRIYELAPRVEGIAARNDQQAAGIIMNLGSLPIVWGVMGSLWARYVRRERSELEPV